MAVQTETEKGIVFTGRTHKGGAFGAGILAGAVFSLATLLLYSTGIVPRTLANLVADKISATLPGNFTEIFIQSIGALGKQLEFFTVLLGQVLVGGLLGLLLVLIWPRMRGVASVWRNSFTLLGVFWLLTIAGGVALVDQGPFGMALGNAQLPLLISSFLLFALFGAALAYFFIRIVPAVQPVAVTADDGTTQMAREERLVVGTTKSRRSFVATVSGLFVLVTGGAVIAAIAKSARTDNNLAFGDITSPTDQTPVTGVTPQPTTAATPGGSSATTPVVGSNVIVAGEVTPTKDFYHVSKNATDPTGVGNGWKLQINGLVNTPMTLTIADIKALPSVTTYHTLTCISNPVGGGYISNAKWKGARMRDILAKAGVKAEGQRIVFTCADGYTDSIPVAKAMEDDTIGAYEMNDAALPDDHGAPMRMLIPNIYGMKNAKWVQSFTVVADANYEGFWAKQGWDNIATIHTVSAITSPLDPATAKIMTGETTALKGYAYAGDRGIQTVEVSTDNGKTWNAATIKARLSHNSWTIWQYNWMPASEGDYVLQVRATDGMGAPQDSTPADTYPSGASGYQSLTFHVSKKV